MTDEIADTTNVTINIDCIMKRCVGRLCKGKIGLQPLCMFELNSDGTYSSRCKKCIASDKEVYLAHNEYVKDWAKRNPENNRAARRRYVAKQKATNATEFTAKDTQQKRSYRQRQRLLDPEGYKQKVRDQKRLERARKHTKDKDSTK